MWVNKEKVFLFQTPLTYVSACVHSARLNSAPLGLSLSTSAFISPAPSTTASSLGKVNLSHYLLST